MALLWASDLTQADSTSAGWQADTGGNRDTAAGLDAASGLARPVPVTTTPDGRRAMSVGLPDQSHRNEILPNHATFAEGAGGVFASCFWVPTGFPTAQQGSYYQVIEQMRQASYVGSPPLAFEARDSSLIISGGAGMGASGTPDQYKYEKYLKAPLGNDRWLPLIYSLTNMSATPGACTLSVWLGREPLLTGWTIPPPMIVAAPSGQTGNTDGKSYRKMGVYHWTGNGPAQLWIGPCAYGTTFADVDWINDVARYPRRTPRPVGA